MTDNRSNYEKVLEFYKSFKQDEYIPDENTKSSLDESVISEERLHLKMSLIAEEFNELVEAVYGLKSAQALEDGWLKAKSLDDGTRDRVEAADALGDMKYVIAGLEIESKMPADKIFDEIHLSNLSKLDENGEPIVSDGVTPAIHDGQIKPKGKILKGKDYFDPDIEAILDGKEPDRTPKIIKDQDKM